MWVVKNKLKRIIKKQISFENYVDYANVLPNVITSKDRIQKSKDEIMRKSYLKERVKKVIQLKNDDHYTDGEYFNL